MKLLASLATALLVVCPLISAQSKPAEAQPPVQDLRAGADDNKRYFLIGPKEGARQPAEGFKLLLVLPGGDGSAEFRPFVSRIAQNNVPDGYVVAQLVAPQWSAEQAVVLVWPTKNNPSEDAKFTTEEFIDAVIEDVKAKHKIDSRRIFALSWSSGGPPTYAASLTNKTQITGCFIAMSVFHPEALPDLSRAKGQAYFLLHSPQDWIRIAFAEAARDQLAANGAATKLETYQGQHGWGGGAMNHIRPGLEWLEAQTQKRQKAETQE